MIGKESSLFAIRMSRYLVKEIAKDAVELYVSHTSMFRRAVMCMSVLDEQEIMSLTACYENVAVRIRFSSKRHHSRKAYPECDGERQRNLKIGAAKDQGEERPISNDHQETGASPARC